MKPFKFIKNPIYSSILILALMFSSCSNPKKEAFDFAFSNNKIGGVNLFDKAEKIKENIDAWRTEYEVNSYQEPYNTDKRIVVTINLSKKTTVKINYNLSNYIITGIEIQPIFNSSNSIEDLNAFYELVREYVKPNYEPIGNGNTYQNKIDKDSYISLNAIDNPAYNNVNYYCDYASVLSNNLRAFYEKLKNKKIQPKRIIVDYKDGTVEVPKNKIWVLITRKLVSESLIDSTKQLNSTSKTCDQITVDNYLVTPDIIINNQCLISKGIISAGEGGSFKNYGGGVEAIYADKNIYKIMEYTDMFDCRLLIEGATLCVPPSSGYGKPLVEIDEFNLNEVEELKSSIILLTKMGQKNSDIKFLKMLNNKF